MGTKLLKRQVLALPVHSIGPCHILKVQHFCLSPHGCLISILKYFHQVMPMNDIAASKSAARLVDCNAARYVLKQPSYVRIRRRDIGSLAQIDS